MRTTLGVLAACCLVVGTARWVRADDQSEARAIIAKAIKATGGEEKLKKHNALKWKETGTYYGMGDGLPYTGEYAVQWPHQFRIEISGVFIIVLNGDQGWISAGGDTREMTAEELAQQKEEHYAGWVSTLVSLKDKMFKLSTLGETKVNERPAVGVRVSAEKHRDVNLFFDKERGLLVKAEYRTISQEQGGKEVTQEVLYSDYKDFDGVQVAIKMAVKRDGERFVEAEVTEVNPAGKLDDSVFGKP